MQQQNINLLLQLPKKPKILLPIKLQLQILIGFFCFLMIVYFVGLSNLSNLKKDLNNLHEKQNEVNKEIANLIKITPSYNKNFNAMQKQNIRFDYFSKYLETLAEKTPVNIWFDQIYFSNSLTKTFILSGKTTSESNLPDFLNTLNNDKNFYGENFSTVNIKKDPKENVSTIVIQNYRSTDKK